MPERAQAQQQQRLQQHSQQQQQQQQQQQLSNVVDLSQDAPPTSTGIVGLRTSSSSSGGGVGQASAAMPAAHADAGPPQAAKPLRSSKDLKARLMATLQAIKAAESGGYFNRQEVEKVGRHTHTHSFCQLPDSGCRCACWLPEGCEECLKPLCAAE
jgi:hypothetical protein